VVRLIPYVMMPTHYRHWSFGKRAEEQMRDGGTFHIFEAVINSNPSHCYLGITNTVLMQILVMAHAKYGHVDFFANNKTFAETMPDSLDTRLAQHKEYIERLVNNPVWGWDRVEYILDAAHALDEFVGWLPSNKGLGGEAEVTDKEERDKLESRLVELQLKLPKIISEFEKEGVKAEIAEIEARLKLVPLHPTDDILGFLMDPKQNPRLNDEQRGILAIVRDQARYFQPQGRTKIMNEGWASFWEKELLLQPEVNLPFTWRLEGASHWSMHTRQITNLYFDPYALGLKVFEHIHRKDNEGKTPTPVEVEVEDGDWRKMTEAEANGAELTPSREGVTCFDAGDGMVWESTGKTKTVTVQMPSYERILEVRRNHTDASFIRNFMTEELFEEINMEALDYVRRTMKQITRLLIEKNWSRQLIREPLPNDLNGMMELVQLWMNAAEMSEMFTQEGGTPPFPVHPQTLKSMATVLQIVAAFDEDKKKTRNMLVMRTAYISIPVIKVADNGTFSDGTATLLHVYDETFGPLKPSECRDTLKYFRRLWGRPARLLTKEIRTDRFGRPLGPPVPYEYFCDEDGEIKERYLE
jgi:spore cortex formation protein SpoVR/YcgB (stage V sporulation)